MASIVIIASQINNNMSQLNIFLIDKDQSLLNNFKQNLDASGYNQVSAFNRATDSDIYLSRQQPDVVFLGNSLGYGLSMELLKCFRSVYPDTNVILMPDAESDRNMMRIANSVETKAEKLANYMLCVLDRLAAVKSSQRYCA